VTIPSLISYLNLGGGGPKRTIGDDKEGGDVYKERTKALLENTPHTERGRVRSSRTVNVCKEGRGRSRRAVLLNWRVQMTARFVPSCGAQRLPTPDGDWRLGKYCKESPS